MRTDEPDTVSLRKWQLDFDEVAGRGVPPDRVHEILRRASSEVPATHPQPSSSRALWTAALVLLGVAATIGVSVLDRGEESPSTPGSMQGKAKDKKKDQTPSTAGNPSRPVGVITHLSATGQLLTVQVRRGSKALKKGGTLLIARGRDYKGEMVITEIDASGKHCFGRVTRRAKSGIAIGDQVTPILSASARNPLLRGDYFEALRQLSEKRQALDHVTDAAKARKMLDDMSRILSNAKRALWEMEKTKPGKGKSDK